MADRSAPRRTVVHAEALAWLAANPATPGTSVVTSLPDVSEVRHLDFPAWRAWFVDAARRLIRWLPHDGVAIFFQSDVRLDGRWVDKGHLVTCAVDAEDAFLLWHKIVCRRPPGTVAQGRPSFSHMLCAAKSPRQAPVRPGPDVIPDAGFMPWARAMGETACQVACRFLRDETATRTVVDPFCGHGSILAVANGFGFDAVGVDRSARRCREALAQDLNPASQRRWRRSDTRPSEP